MGFGLEIFQPMGGRARGQAKGVIGAIWGIEGKRLSEFGTYETIGRMEPLIAWRSRARKEFQVKDAREARTASGGSLFGRP